MNLLNFIINSPTSQLWQVTIGLMQYGAVATSNEDILRSFLFRNYNKDEFPIDVWLEYAINYLECPVPDSNTSILISNVAEVQVCTATFFGLSSSSSSFICSLNTSNRCNNKSIVYRSARQKSKTWYKICP